MQLANNNPRSKRVNPIRGIKSVVFGLGLLLTLAILTSSAGAATNDVIGRNIPLPDSGTSGGSNFTPLSGVGRGSFDGNYSLSKVYVPVGNNAQITIDQVCPDPIGSPSVTYIMYAMTERESSQGGVARNWSDISQGGSCSKTVRFNIPANSGDKSTVPGHAKYRVFAFVAKMNNPSGSSAERYFRVNTDAGYIGVANPSAFVGSGFLSDSENKFFGLYKTSGTWSYSVMFAPKCDYNNDRDQEYMKIYDADNGNYQNNMRAELEWADRGSIDNPAPRVPVWHNEKSWDAQQVQSGNWGSSGTEATLGFQASKNKIYRFTVKDSTSPNTIQIRLPFDQIDGDAGLFNYKGCDYWRLEGNSRIKNDNGDWVTNDQIKSSVETAQFKHDVKNNGPNDATYRWEVQGRYYGRDGSFSNSNRGGNQISGSAGGGNLQTSGGNITRAEDRHGPQDTIYKYKFPNNAVAGDRYCQRIWYSDAGGKNKPADTSDEVCAVFTEKTTVSCDPTTKTGTAYVVNKGGYIGPAGNLRPTRTFVTSTGFNNTATGAPISAYVPSVGGENSGIQSKEFNITATATDPTIFITRQYWNGTSWKNISTDTYAKPACFPQPSCGTLQAFYPTHIQRNDSVWVQISVEGTNLPAAVGFLFGTNTGLKGYSAGRFGATDKYWGQIPADILNEAREYQIVWPRPGGAGWTDICTGSLTVSDLPYFTAYGGGIRAGGNFASTEGGDAVNPFANGWLAGWYQTKDNNIGSNSNLSALASIRITGVASAQYSNSPTKPVGLSFANGGTCDPNPWSALGFCSSEDITSKENSGFESDDFSPKLGGKFNAPTLLYDPTQPADAQELGGLIGDVAYLAPNAAPLTNSGAYYSDGHNVVLFASDIADNPDGSGKNVTIFVNDGDVLISNLFYTQLKFAASQWAPDKVPSFTLVVTGGDIYIQPGITLLEGTYVAKHTGGNNGKGGTIYTCGNDLGAPVKAGDTDYKATCGQQLVVNGSFVADQINLMRTFGTVKEAVFAGFRAAEQFNYSPMQLLGKPQVRPPSNGAGQFDAITSLPPVL